MSFSPTHRRRRATRKGSRLARQIEDRDTGKDARMSLRMRLYDRQDRARERVLTLLSMRGGAGRPVPGYRTLIRFAYPNDIKGAACWSGNHPSATPSDSCISPRLGGSAALPVSEAQESFVGSDFTNEDIGGREFKTTNTMLVAEAAKTGTHPMARASSLPLESRRRGANARFPRVLVARSPGQLPVVLTRDVRQT